MTKIDERTSRFMLESTLARRPDLARELVTNPVGVLALLNTDENALRCTAAAHEAYDRGQALAEELETLGDLSLVEALPRMGEMTKVEFGEGFAVAKVPFGIRFSEQVQPAAMDLSGTATVECSFGLKCHGDVDG